MKQFLQWGCWITIALTALLWFYPLYSKAFWNEQSTSIWWAIAGTGMFVINQVFTWTLFFTQGGPEAIRKLRKHGK